jgi:hypothetical protein
MSRSVVVSIVLSCSLPNHASRVVQRRWLPELFGQTHQVGVAALVPYLVCGDCSKAATASECTQGRRSGRRARDGSRCSLLRQNGHARCGVTWGRRVRNAPNREGCEARGLPGATLMGACFAPDRRSRGPGQRLGVPRRWITYLALASQGPPKSPACSHRDPQR